MNDPHLTRTSNVEGKFHTECSCGWKSTDFDERMQALSAGYVHRQANALDDGTADVRKETT